MDVMFRLITDHGHNPEVVFVGITLEAVVLLSEKMEMK